jgi:hypothetical protein
MIRYLAIEAHLPLPRHSIDSHEPDYVQDQHASLDPGGYPEGATQA